MAPKRESPLLCMPPGRHAGQILGILANKNHRQTDRQAGRGWPGCSGHAEERDNGAVPGWISMCCRVSEDDRSASALSVPRDSELNLAGREGLILHHYCAAAGQDHDAQFLLLLVCLLVPLPGHCCVVRWDEGHLGPQNRSSVWGERGTFALACPAHRKARPNAIPTTCCRRPGSHALKEGRLEAAQSSQWGSNACNHCCHSTANPCPVSLKTGSW